MILQWQGDAPVLLINHEGFPSSQYYIEYMD